MTEQAQAVLTLLRERGIPFDVAEHVPVYTIEEMLSLHLPDAGSVAKNLFLRDDKRRNYYLLVIREEKTADLKALRERIGARPLSFASENDLERFLKVPKGSVTPFGVLNDQERKVRVIFDVSFQGVCQPGSAGGNRIVCFLASVPKSVAQDIIPGRTAFVSPEWLLAAAGVAGNTAGTRAQAGSGPFQENLIQGVAPDLARALTEGALRLPSPRTRAPRAGRG